MGKGVVYPFSSNSLFVISRRIETEAVDKMIAHFVTAPSFSFVDNKFHPLGETGLIRESFGREFFGWQKKSAKKYSEGKQHKPAGKRKNCHGQ